CEIGTDFFYISCLKLQTRLWRQCHSNAQSQKEELFFCCIQQKQVFSQRRMKTPNDGSEHWHWDGRWHSWHECAFRTAPACKRSGIKTEKEWLRTQKLDCHQETRYSAIEQA
ncbi:MAG: hypothetical protein RR650_09890, partial [Comamonas sp.]